MIHIQSLTYRIGGRVLLDKATLHIAAGQRVGLIGHNGAGKSTVFKLILNDLHPDEGTLILRQKIRIGSLSQNMPDSHLSLIDYVLEQDLERKTLLIASESGDSNHDIADIHERLFAVDAHTAPARAAAILSGLGFNTEAQNRPVNSFSGGWRMRVALAGTLFSKPDLLLLDEPTNHLDLEASLWLEGFLASYEGTLILISHDRDILNKAVDRIVHIDGLKLVAYGGNYDRFEQVRREKIELQQKAAGKQAEERKKLQSFIDRFRAKASKATQAQSRIKMLERLGPPIALIEETTMRFDFPNPDELAPPLLSIDEGVAGYKIGHPILRDLSFRLDLDDRVALLGANGNGKSTLAKVLANELPLLSGYVTRSTKLKIGYFSQDQADMLVLDQSAYQHIQELMPQLQESKLRAQLGRFGFSRDRADIPVKNLSGGEKARLLFALMSRQAPHLMILDEPTNHLDIDSRDALVEALNSYQGAILLISHDARLIELVAERLWLVNEGKVVPYEGDMQDYRKFLLSQSRDSREPKQKKDKRKQQDREVQSFKKSLDKIEREISQSQKQIIEIDMKMAEISFYNDIKQVEETTKEKARLQNSLKLLENQWLDLQSKLDQG
jgi:ATP-binding cassette subfamily F protein 3